MTAFELAKMSKHIIRLKANDLIDAAFMRILIVDDSEEVRDELRDSLTAAGHACEVAGDGESALQRIAAQHYDCIFLDLFLPKVGGETVLKHVGEHQPDTKVVVMSVDDGDLTIVRALSLGATAYVIKPLTAEKVIGIMHKLYKSSQGGNDVPRAKFSAPKTTIGTK